MDLSQAVLGSFFVRAAAGQYDLDTPEHLLKLLATMARNKLSKARRDQLRARRDARRKTVGGAEVQLVPAATSTPSQQVAARELLAEVRQRLSKEEGRVMELRNQGYDWAGIAAELGSSPEALRNKLTRAVDRVAGELGLDEEEGG
jgi:RNA polymerase sigma-70 factor (ECF subfamily)